MTLLFEKRDSVAWITINRPERHNAVDTATRKLLSEAWAEVEQNQQIRVAVLTGAGDRAFCAGADLSQAASGESSFIREYLDRETRALSQPLDHLTKPVIAAINGYAFGGGMELALACDLRIASEQAELALTEVRVGSMPGSGGTQRLLRAIPAAVAAKMLLTGQRISAQEAYRVGLVSDLVSANALLPFAEELAEQIARNAPLAIRAVKMVTQASPGMSLDQGLLLERMVFGLLRGSEDWLEGRRAFREKRPPVYGGEPNDYTD